MKLTTYDGSTSSPPLVEQSRAQSRGLRLMTHIRRLGILLLIFSLIGCDAFVRKFTRKPNKDNIAKEELVLVPEVYKNTMTKEQLYRQYFLFWKSWQDELLEALSNTAATNHKKQVECAQQGLNNLVQIRALLSGEKQKILDKYISQLSDLAEAIRNDTYGTNRVANHQAGERIKMRILRDFSFEKIKGALV